MGRSRLIAACGSVMFTSWIEILLIRFGFCAMVTNTSVNVVYRRLTSSNDWLGLITDSSTASLDSGEADC